MGKISKIELRVREQILKKENLLKALRFDVETLNDRIIATKGEIVTLNEILADDKEEENTNVKKD